MPIRSHANGDNTFSTATGPNGQSSFILHSQSQRFFVGVSFKFSNNRCRYTAYGNFAILESLKSNETL